MMNRYCLPTAMALSVALSAAPGCEIQPYCVGGICGDAGLPDGTDGDGTGGEFQPTDDGAPPEGDQTDGETDDTPPECDLPLVPCGDACVDPLIDPANCGGCGNRCGAANALVACAGGECRCTACYPNFVDCDGACENGCEYYCVRDPRLTEPCDPATCTGHCDITCDNRDDDCNCTRDDCVDKMTDEDNCGACGNRCRYRYANATAECIGGSCATPICNCGYWNVDGDNANGCEYECGPTTGTPPACDPPPAETCNGFDDDCDGAIDDGDPEGGGACGTDAGECEFGVERCMDARIACVGGVGPVEERCNNRDDDCDGETDEGDPEAGVACGPAIGECRQGVSRCVAGTLDCIGGVRPSREICDGRDNDCNGVIDNDPILTIICFPPPPGICIPGTPGCVGGVEVCVGEVPGVPEICNGIDDNCNGQTDEGFNLSSDPRNCGSCGHVCNLTNVSTNVCVGGVCQVGVCAWGFWNANGNHADGCEYACTYNGAETCNNRDDDCDTLVDAADPDMAANRPAPSAICVTSGACAAATVSCGLYLGSIRWYCTYPSPVVVDPATGAIQPETRCNSVDEDCDGATDENWPGVRHGPTDPADSCTAGIGGCQRTGIFVCTADGLNQVCNATAGAPVAESCNGIDDNCDGQTDNGIAQDNFAAWGAVQIQGAVDANRPRDGVRESTRNFYVMRWEASRPDATATSAGTITNQRVCSRTGVLPWTDITWTQARDACCRLNNTGTCDGTGRFWGLCNAWDWELACELSGAATYYTYPYGNTYAANTCNGNDFDTNTGVAGDQDDILATGTMTGCRNSAAFPPSNSWIFDASGNVKEWTRTSRVVSGTTYYEIRGGASNNAAPGLTCPFDFTLGSGTFSFPNVGFRCCYYP